MKKLVIYAFTLLLLSAAVQAQNPQYRISVTNGGDPLGDIVIELFPDVAPKHVHNFDSLVSVGFYNTTAFHRARPGFVVQGGGINSRTDRGMPRNTWGQSDPSQTTVPAEFNSMKHVRGIISGARLPNNINSYTSQFFICLVTLTSLDNEYTIFGRVLSGMDIVDQIAALPKQAGTDFMPVEKVEMMVTKITASSADDEGARLSGPALSPNPTAGITHIRAYFRKSENVSVEIFNILGERVATLYSGEAAEGENVFLWNAENYPEGSYIYRIRSGQDSRTGTVSVIKH